MGPTKPVLIALVVTLGIPGVSSVTYMVEPLLDEAEGQAASDDGAIDLLDPGSMAPWPSGWHVQPTNRAVAYRSGDEILLINPYGYVRSSFAEAFAPCDPYSYWNGVDGRWFVRPTTSTGVPYAGYYVKAELLSALPFLSPTVLVAYYQKSAAGCTRVGYDTGGGTIQKAFPAGTTHMFVMTTLPVTANDLYANAAYGQSQLYLEACTRTNCYWSAALGETKGWFSHPSPNPFGLPSISPIT